MAERRKHYHSSDSHSPILFTVQYFCIFSEILGTSVISECEGVSTILFVLLSRFKLLPRVFYYDNAYDMLRSVAVTVPWVYKKCLIVYDRFHCNGRTCSSVCDPGKYLSCTYHSNSGAESINHLSNFSKAHMRYLSGENEMKFLTARAIFYHHLTKFALGIQED